MDARTLLEAIAKKDTTVIQESFNSIMADKVKVLAEEVLAEQASQFSSAAMILNTEDEV